MKRFSWPWCVLAAGLLAAAIVGASNSTPPAANDKNVPRLKEIADDDEKADFAGVWLVQGKQGDASYAGVCLVTHEEDVIGFTWANKHNASVGVGIRKGRSIAVQWRTSNGVPGLTLYHVSPDGKSLHGSWTALPTSGQTFTETLTFLRKLPVQQEARNGS